MCHLRCDYEKETQEKCCVDQVLIKALPTWEYVRWLEAKVFKKPTINLKPIKQEPIIHKVSTCPCTICSGIRKKGYKVR
jgi:hypothetical protein